MRSFSEEVLAGFFLPAQTAKMKFCIGDTVKSLYARRSTEVYFYVTVAQ